MAEFGSNPGKDKGRPSISRFPPREPQMKKPPDILIVEDNHADVFLMREALAAANLAVTVHVVNDGDEAFRFIDRADANQAAPCPRLFILDFNLPKRSGLEVLEHLRQSRKCSDAVVLIATSSDSAQDRNRVAALGADAYFRKPSCYDDYLKLGEIVRTMLPSTPR